MNWFDGTLKEAISFAKENKAVFVVVVSGAGDGAEIEKLYSVLEDSKIISKFAKMVCIRLENGSAAFDQFAAIYPVKLIPSIYFIGR